MNVLAPEMLIAKRFAIETLANTGGMGAVYRAKDLQSGDLVAIKVLHVSVGTLDEADRFAREVQILAELRHPAIVSYISHGVLETGQPYMVMEWLAGEELSRRLSRGPLSPRESLMLIRRITQALSVAHQRRIIHRDIKPANLILRNDAIEQVTLLDFGVARRTTLTESMTRTGFIIGTPEYMAPEQARGQREITPSADIFSLGCVFFECLTGQPPFTADLAAGVMAKILFEPAPLLRSLRPDLPESLDLLLAAMLEKDPAARPQDASELLQAMASLDANISEISVRASQAVRPVRQVTPAEQQLVSVLLAHIPSLVPGGDSETTAVAPGDSDEAKAFVRALNAFGAKVEILADGSIIATVTQGRHMTATDQVAQAARCALALRQRFPDAISTLTTGRGLLGGQRPFGDAIERSARLLKQSLGSEPPPLGNSGEVIFLDEVTAVLLDTRFETRRLEGGIFALRGERVSINAGRSLLGRPTPFIGRDRELSVLDLLYAECRDDATPRVVLVTAAAGMGKSRLRYEFLHRLAARREPMQLMMSRGDPLTTGSPYALLGQAVRYLCNISEGQSPFVQRSKLAQHIQSRLPQKDASRVEEFLGELCGVPAFGEPSAKLLTARHDERVMTEQLHHALIELLRAECDRHPLLLVLEDLHWGDTPTVRLVDAALRELSGCSLMVLALARPEIELVFPRLWIERRRQDLRLEGLSRKASERLVHAALGDNVSKSVTARVIEQSAGNALFLEELIRAVAEGKGHELPETVLAMLQSRLLRLEPPARRVLRGASILGQSFARSALVAVLRTEHGVIDLDHWLHMLTDAEILELQREPAESQDPQYRFRHALLRDAAYSLLTSDHQKLGHRLAAAYLEQLDDSDPVVMADHYERGGDLARASSLYLRAAELAHRRGDGDTAVALGRRGLICAPDEIVRIGLLVVLCQVYLWRNQWALAAEFAEDLLQLSSPGSPAWAIGATAMLVHVRHTERDQFVEMLESILHVEPEIDAIGMMAFALSIGVYLLDSQGAFAQAELCVRRLHEIVEPVAMHNPIARGWMHSAHAHREAWVAENPWAGLVSAQSMQESFLEANHIRGALDAQVFIGMNAWCLGATEWAERELRATLPIGENLGLVSSLRTFLFVRVLCERGEFAEAELEARALSERHQSTTGLARGLGQWALGEVLTHQGKHSAAIVLLAQALASLKESPLDTAAVYVSLARAYLLAGQTSAALRNAEEALRQFTELTTFGLRGLSAQAVYAEALLASGNPQAAADVATKACERLARQAEQIGNAQFRQSFLCNVPEHRRLRELAKAEKAAMPSA